jgi:hypothetical protein
MGIGGSLGTGSDGAVDAGCSPPDQQASIVTAQLADASQMV